MSMVIAALQHLPIVRRLLHIQHVPSASAGLVRESELLLRSAVFRHACKTPLAVLLTSLSMISDAPKPAAAQAKAGDNFQPARIGMSATRQLIQLFNQLEGGGRATEYFTVSAAVREVVTLLNRGQVQYVSYLDEASSVLGNRLYFQEALACVITNAQESYEKNDVAYVWILTKTTRQARVDIEVIDFGRGMSPLAQRLAMLEGVSYKSTGTGLGLSFTRHAINELMHGEVSLSSQLGFGTRVRLSLPLARQTGTQIREQS